MFDRFTNDAKKAVVVAQEEARGQRRPAIEFDDILVGVLSRPRSVGPWLLAGLGVDVDAALADLRARRAPGPGAPSGHLPFTPAAKAELEQLPYTIALLRDEHIGTEHLVLVTLVAGRTQAAQVLRAAGVDAARYRVAIEAHEGRVRSGAVHDETPHLVRAVEHLRAADGATALAEAELALADAIRTGEQPELAHAQNLLAWIICLGVIESRLGEALAMVDHALASLPGEQAIVGTRLAVLTLMGRGAECVAGHEQILALGDEVLAGERGVSHSFLARALLDAGDLEQARAHLREAERHPPMWPIHADTWRRLDELDGRWRPGT